MSGTNIQSCQERRRWQVGAACADRAWLLLQMQRMCEVHTPNNISVLCSVNRSRAQTPLVCMNSCTLRPAVDSSVKLQRESLKHAGTFQKDISRKQRGGKNGSSRGAVGNVPLKNEPPPTHPAVSAAWRRRVNDTADVQTCILRFCFLAGSSSLLFSCSPAPAARRETA